MQKIVGDIYSLVNKISINEQRIVNEDIYIERINGEIIRLGKDKSRLQTLKIAEIKHLKDEREKAKNNINRLMNKNDDLYNELENLVQCANELDAIADTLIMLNNAKEFFEKTVEDLVPRVNKENEAELILRIKDNEAARDTFDFAMGICKGISHKFEVVKKYPGNKDVN